MIGLGRAFCRRSTLSSLLTKGANTTLGQVQVQMVAVGLVRFGAEYRRKDATGALVHLAQKKALLRCRFLCSVGERPRITARYGGLSRHLRLRLQIASRRTPGRKDIDCATIVSRERCNIERICVRMFALLAARIADPRPTGVA